MYGVTTLASSINVIVDGSGSLLVFCWGFALLKELCVGSDCLVGLCEGDPFHLQGIQV